jgi:hypothetical protein
MNTRIAALSTIGLCLAIAGSFSAEKTKTKVSKMNKEKILEVDRVTVSHIKTSSPQLQIEADGKTGSAGWSEPELVARVYIVPPADVIYDYDFVAKPPPEVAAQVLTPISAKAIRNDVPKGMKGVRVHAQTNKKEAKLAR